MNSREGSHAVDISAPSGQGSEVELRFLPDAMDYNEACSTSNVNQSVSSCRRFRKIRSRGIGQRSRHKRWKGRLEVLDNFPDVPLVVATKEPYENNKSMVEEEQVFS